mmetsp:Transcript_5943/g.13027  ORF Transcript_5943/g.13027 Transcript_5943/m.13027 type:complete len:99 (-) Transcript_5943:133-429(-)
MRYLLCSTLLLLLQFLNHSADLTTLPKRGGDAQAWNLAALAAWLSSSSRGRSNSVGKQPASMIHGALGDSWAGACGYCMSHFVLKSLSFASMAARPQL